MILKVYGWIFTKLAEYYTLVNDVARSPSVSQI